MEVEYLKRLIEGKKVELMELEAEYMSSVNQFLARKTSLETQIGVFEDDLKRFDR